MATEEVPVERKPRKSVAFSDGAVVVDENGKVTMKQDLQDERGTALSHSTSHEGSIDKPAEEEEEDVAAMLKGMKKKKSKKPKAEEGEEGGDAETPAAADGELDLSMMKKKKKSKKPKDGVEDDFEAKLAALDLEGKGGEGEAATTAVAEKKPIDEGDMDQGTGIWAHTATTQIPYELLLNRFFKLLEQKNPDHASSGSKSYKIPPPQCLREGNKKTIFANIAEICKRMNRSEEHVTSYLFAELGTSGSVDGSRRLVIKGRFQQKMIENVLRRYIMEYITCKTCKSPHTELIRGENRLFFITCNSCGSRRSVPPIKTGFSAQVGKRRRQQG